MLDKIPMELIRRAARDDAALQELCKLLEPSVQPILAVLSKAVWNPAILQKWFAATVRAAVQAPRLAEVKDEALRGLPLANFMLDLGHAATALADTVQRSRPRAVGPPGPPARDAVLGGGGSSDLASAALSVFFDLSKSSPDEVLAILLLLSDLYRSVGGDGLAIRTVGTMQPALIPVGV